jgi:hypothetical protein
MKHTNMATTVAILSTDPPNPELLRTAGAAKEREREREREKERKLSL